MIDPWIWGAAAALGGAALAAAPSAAATAAAGVAVLLWRRGARPGLAAVCVLLFCAQGWRGRGALADARQAHALSVAAFTPPAVCEARAVVVEAPVASVRDEGRVAARAAVRVEEGSCDGRPIPTGLVARVYDLPDDLRRGDRLDVTAKLLPVHLFEHRELPSPWPVIARTEVVASGACLHAEVLARPLSLAGSIDAARAFVRRRILATYTPSAAGFARALVLGETDLPEDDIEAFRDSGLLHILAVSGTHLVLVVSAMSFVLRWLLLRVSRIAERADPGRVSAAFGIVAAWLYADFAGGSGSAIRAAAMLTAALLARALGRRGTPGRALALSLLAAAIVDPLVALDVSFTLSTGATCGLVVLGGPLSQKLLALARVEDPERGASPAEGASAGGPASAATAALRGAARHVLTSVGTTLAATVGSAPAMLRLSPRLPILGVLANVVAAPIGELLALPLCLVHAVTAPIPPLERALALAGSGALLSVRAVARSAAQTGGSLDVRPPTPAELAAVAILAAAIALSGSPSARRAWLAAGGGALLLLEVIAGRAGAPRDVLRVTALDVGQGDAILIDLPDGRSMLIDGGGMVGNPVDPGSRVILPVLAARRRSKVDVLVLTHPHPDHFTGLATVAEKVPFDELWESGQGEAHGARGAYARLLAAARAGGAQIKRPETLCGHPRWFGAARVEVLSPCPRLRPDIPANDASVVVRIDFGRRSALFVGDAEVEAEHEMMRSGARLGADLLKVGHHGSRTSSSAEMLGAVAPQVAMISCGVRNRFGHPHPLALARLADARAQVVRTDQGGAITWETDGEGVRLFRP